MSHDIEAAYASSEIADIIMKKQQEYFGNQGQGSWSVYATREGGNQWPFADAVIHAENAKMNFNIAFEYKRPNEGVHGILTALGQSFAYLEKGYDASIIVIPEKYSSHPKPGDHAKRILNAAAENARVAIFTYSTPKDWNAKSPFEGCLTPVREISLANYHAKKRLKEDSSPSSVSTLWAHMREGVSHPDAFFRYCQSVKITSLNEKKLKKPQIPQQLRDAVNRIDPSADVYDYLSYTTNKSISDKSWRYTWFNFYFAEDVMPLYSSDNPFVVNDTPTKIRIDENTFQTLLSAKSNSAKNKIITELNKQTKSLDEAWEEYARSIHNLAHSYREDIDSGLNHIGFLAGDGMLTELGYKYVEACERIGHSFSGMPFEILRSAILQKGQYGVLLHYIHKLSEEKFNEDLFAFTQKTEDGRPKLTPKGEPLFDRGEYLRWLSNLFSDELHIIKKSSERSDEKSGKKRKPFQAERWALKKYGFVRQKNGKANYRVGLGLDIDWPQVQQSMLNFQEM